MQLNSYLSTYPELQDLYSSVEQDFIQRGLIHHNWQHNLRDLARGILIGEAEQANMKIVLAAIILHDIGRLHPEPGKDHHTTGAAIAPGLLRKSAFLDQEIEEICHCIRAYGPRGIEEPATLAAKVCYDVDVLSCAVGFIGVARVFDYFMREEGMNVKQMMKTPSGRKGLRQDLYTRTGRSLGASGFKNATNFWRALHEEFCAEQKLVIEIIPDYEGD